MDPAASRCLFPLTEHFIYLNHAGSAPMSDRARAAIEALMEHLTCRPYPDGLAQEEADRLALLEWIRTETERRGVKPADILEGLRAGVRRQVLK